MELDEVFTRAPQRIETDVLIIGGGAGGMMAAVGALRAGVKPLVVTKGGYGSGSSSMARGGYTIAVGHSDPADHPELYYEDAITAGYGLSNPRLARLMSYEAIERTWELEAWGLGLAKLPDGRFHQKPTSMPHRFARLVHCGKLMGKPLMQALSKRTRALGSDVMDHFMVVDLLREGERVVGVWGFDYKHAMPYVIHARSTVLATGGAPQLHELNDSPSTITGDGYAMALRAGAELIDMEFIDYQLLTAAPTKLVGYPCHSSGFLNHGGYLINREGERFMHRYDAERMERAPRALINRGVAMEIFEGRGTENSAVCIDIRHVYDVVNNGATADVIRTFARAGVDPREAVMEVTSGPHTYLGGVRIDEWGRSTIKGLYAGGEAVGGVHGANRLGGAALSDTYVFGLRSGMAAACEADEHPAPAAEAGRWRDAVERLRADLDAPRDGEAPERIRRDVQGLVVHSIGQVRRADRLQSGMAKLDEFERALDRSPITGADAHERSEALRRHFETRNVVSVAMLATAALARKESRGGHFRLDYPELDDVRYRGNIVLWSAAGELRHELRAVPSPEAMAPAPKNVPNTVAQP